MDLNVKAKNYKASKTRENLHNLWVSKDFLEYKVHKP